MQEVRYKPAKVSRDQGSPVFRLSGPNKSGAQDTANPLRQLLEEALLESSRHFAVSHRKPPSSKLSAPLPA